MTTAVSRAEGWEEFCLTVTVILVSLVGVLY